MEAGSYFIKGRTELRIPDGPLSDEERQAISGFLAVWLRQMDPETLRYVRAHTPWLRNPSATDLRPRVAAGRRRSMPVIVTHLATEEKQQFPSQIAAAKALGLRHMSISEAVRRGRPYRGYRFEPSSPDFGGGIRQPHLDPPEMEA